MLSGSEPEFLTPEKSFKTSCRIGADPSNLIVEVDAFMQTSIRHSVDVRVVTFIVTPEIVDVGGVVGVAEGEGVGVGVEVLVSELIAGTDGVGVGAGVGVGVGEVPIGSLV